MSKDNPLIIIDDDFTTHIQLYSDSSLMVKDILNWMTGLIQLVPHSPNAIYIRMKDVETGAVFEIRRVE